MVAQSLPDAAFSMSDVRTTGTCYVSSNCKSSTVAVCGQPLRSFKACDLHFVAESSPYHGVQAQASGVLSTPFGGSLTNAGANMRRRRASTADDLTRALRDEDSIAAAIDRTIQDVTLTLPPRCALVHVFLLCFNFLRIQARIRSQVLAGRQREELLHFPGLRQAVDDAAALHAKTRHAKVDLVRTCEATGRRSSPASRQEGSVPSASLASVLSYELVSRVLEVVRRRQASATRRSRDRSKAATKIPTVGCPEDPAVVQTDSL
jgi:hypothetical protein